MYIKNNAGVWICCEQSDLNLEDYLQNKHDGKLELPKQPYILALREVNNLCRCFIILEYQALTVHSVRKAFDTLYKSFHVFNLEYPKALEPLYGFIDLIHNDRASVPNSVREKFNLLYV